MTPQHEATTALLEEYALGYLSPDERRQVEEHVRTCADCSAALNDLTLVMEGLARAPEALSPPPALKQRVLRNLESAPAKSDTQSGSRRGGGRLVPWLAAAAAVLLLVGSLVVSQRRENPLSFELQRLAGDVVDLQRRLDDVVGQSDLALSILTAPDMRPINLAAGDGSASAARAYWSPTRGLLVAADRLPVPPAGRVYQVWLIGSGAPVSAGLLTSPASGRGMLIAPPPSGIAAGPVTVAVTDEPPGGLAAPTGGKHLIGSL